jgi:hypothetical protein
MQFSRSELLLSQHHPFSLLLVEIVPLHRTP